MNVCWSTDFPGFGALDHFSHFATNGTYSWCSEIILLSVQSKQSIKWYLGEGKNPLAKQHNRRHDDLRSQQDLMTSGKFANTENYISTTYLFFLSFSNMNVVPCDYQIFKN